MALVPCLMVSPITERMHPPHFLLPSLKFLSSILLTSVFFGASTAHAALITYSLYNASSVQSGKTLSGSITLDTTGLTPTGTGGWWVGDTQEANFTAWQFTVSGGPNSFSVSSTDAQTNLGISGGSSFSLFATPTSLSVSGGADFRFGRFPGLDLNTSIFWVNGQGGHYQYLANRAGNVSPDGWLAINPPPGSFPSDGLGGWVMATAVVPEPSTYLWGLLLVGILCFSRRRIRTVS